MSLRRTGATRLRRVIPFGREPFANLQSSLPTLTCLLPLRGEGIESRVRALRFDARALSEADALRQRRRVGRNCGHNLFVMLVERPRGEEAGGGFWQFASVRFSSLWFGAPSPWQTAKGRIGVSARNWGKGAGGSNALPGRTASAAFRRLPPPSAAWRRLAPLGTAWRGELFLRPGTSQVQSLWFKVQSWERVNGQILGKSTRNGVFCFAVRAYLRYFAYLRLAGGGGESETACRCRSIGVLAREHMLRCGTTPYHRGAVRLCSPFARLCSPFWEVQHDPSDSRSSSEGEAGFDGPGGTLCDH